MQTRDLIPLVSALLIPAAIWAGCTVEEDFIDEDLAFRVPPTETGRRCCAVGLAGYDDDEWCVQIVPGDMVTDCTDLMNYAGSSDTAQVNCVSCDARQGWSRDATPLNWPGLGMRDRWKCVGHSFDEDNMAEIVDDCWPPNYVPETCPQSGGDWPCIENIHSCTNWHDEFSGESMCCVELGEYECYPPTNDVMDPCVDPQSSDELFFCMPCLYTAVGGYYEQCAGWDLMDDIPANQGLTIEAYESVDCSPPHPATNIRKVHYTCDGILVRQSDGAILDNDCSQPNCDGV